MNKCTFTIIDIKCDDRACNWVRFFDPIQQRMKVMPRCDFHNVETVNGLRLSGITVTFLSRKEAEVAGVLDS